MKRKLALAMLFVFSGLPVLAAPQTLTGQISDSMLRQKPRGPGRHGKESQRMHYELREDGRQVRLGGRERAGERESIHFERAPQTSLGAKRLRFVA